MDEFNNAIINVEQDKKADQIMLKVSAGKSFPLGAQVQKNGVNFALFSKNATAVELLLFSERDLSCPQEVIKLDPKIHRTFQYWHIFVEGLKAGQIYAYRVDGPFAPEKGHHFDPQKVLLDPYAQAIVGDETYSRITASQPGDNCPQALKGVVVDTSIYDWEGDEHLNIPYSASVIYELHVGGFTRNPNSQLPPEKRGTYAGLIEKIPYLQALGITAVELLPVHQFDPQDAPPGLVNYWGYSTINFFSPHRAYSSRKDPLGPVDEFRDLVKALHKAGIAVILDVVYNHTAEGNENGPTLSFKGLENQIYYILESEQRERYSNYSGCGNTFRGNHPIVSRLILQSLCYWVAEMHVDGFRFDLASVLARDSKGIPLAEATTPHLLHNIETHPILAGTKIIAEAWDAAGLYQVGTFVGQGQKFAEWNGPFRDDVRRFLRGDEGCVPAIAARVMGSPDIYQRQGIDINRSINFITCHDGFTLNDLVSYNQKHNQANGENNQDGMNDNYSWNCGWEGKIDDNQIEALRERQIKNFFTILLMSQGTPMILMGDEIRRSQQGNNNAYCQDNPLSWMDWSGVAKHSETLRFVRGLINFIQNCDLFLDEKLLGTMAGDHSYLTWHGTTLHGQNWENFSHILAYELHNPQSREHLHIIFNAYWQPLICELPPLKYHKNWHLIVDTAKNPPHDWFDPSQAPLISSLKYPVDSRSCIVLMES